MKKFINPRVTVGGNQAFHTRKTLADLLRKLRGMGVSIARSDSKGTMPGQPDAKRYTWNVAGLTMVSVMHKYPK